MVQLLIVDDEPLVQIGIRSMLNWESMGIEIAGTATNGRQAYDIILEKHPEIVITDIKMPIMDGMQLIEKCQSQEHPPLFILLTSYEEFALVKQAISYQVLDYLVKLELTEDVLNAAIQKALGILEKERKQAAIPETGSDLSLLQDNFYIRLLLNLFETEEQFATQCDLLSVSSFVSSHYRCCTAKYHCSTKKCANNFFVHFVFLPWKNIVFYLQLLFCYKRAATYVIIVILYLVFLHA